jgi:hypothetical protein
MLCHCIILVASTFGWRPFHCKQLQMEPRSPANCGYYKPFIPGPSYLLHDDANCNICHWCFRFPKWTYLILTILRLVLAGSYYVYCFIFINSKTSDLYTVWFDLFLWWAVFMFAFTFSPCNLLIYNIIVRSTSTNKENQERNGGPFEILKRLFRNDHVFTLNFVGVNICTFAYAIITVTRKYNMVGFGSERVAVAFLMIRNMFFLIPFALHCQYLEQVTYIIKNSEQYRLNTLTVKMTRDDLVKPKTRIRPFNSPVRNKSSTLLA